MVDAVPDRAELLTRVNFLVDFLHGRDIAIHIERHKQSLARLRQGAPPVERLRIDAQRNSGFDIGNGALVKSRDVPLHVRYAAVLIGVISYPDVLEIFSLGTHHRGGGSLAEPSSEIAPVQLDEVVFFEAR